MHQSLEDDSQVYEEREAVAVFGDEKSLIAAVDDLMQIGFRQEDMSLLAPADILQGTARFSGEIVQQIDDKDDTLRAPYVSPDSRTEELAAIAGLPVYVAGAGAAALLAISGAALIPTIAVVAGGSLAAGALGLVVSRAVGRHHARWIQQQIANGGLLLWVHVPDETCDAEVTAVLRRGGHDVHIHTVKRTWGLADIPLHDFNPDPFLDESITRNQGSKP